MWSIPLIAFLAATVKSATGFGPALVVVGLGTLTIGPEHAIPLSAVLDVLTGTVLLWQTRRDARPAGWRPMAASIAVGAVVGSTLFRLVPADDLLLPLGLSILASTVALWLTRVRRTTAARSGMPPHLAIALCAGSGVLGGMLGVTGPPLAIAASLTYPKAQFRSLLAPVLLCAAVVRVATYAGSGSLTSQALEASALAVLALPAGAWLGDRLHGTIPQRAFDSAIAALLLATGVRLVL